MIKGSHHSEESRKKLSESHKGNQNAKGSRSEEFRLQNSKLHKGQTAWNKGKRTPESVRKKQSESAKQRPNNFTGKQFSKAQLKKLSESHKGQRAWNKGLGQFDWSDPQVRRSKHCEYVKRNREKRRNFPKTRIFLNEYFPNSCLHHMGHGFAVYIPTSLHQSIHHSLTRNQNIDVINNAAIVWLNADVNASFNIAVRQVGVSRSAADRDAVEGCTDTPREATPMSDGDLRTPRALAVGVCQTPPTTEAVLMVK